MDFERIPDSKKFLLTVDTPQELAYLNIESMGILPRVGRVVLSNAVREIEGKGKLPASVELTSFDATRVARHLTKPLKNKKSADRLLGTSDEVGINIVRTAHDFLEGK